MKAIFYFLCLLPSMSINFGVGGIPLRYFAIPLIINFRKSHEIAYLFIIALIIHIAWVFISYLFGRAPHLLDISYILNYLFIFSSLTVAYANISISKKFILCFFYLNAAYALFQGAALNLGLDSQYLLFHQNTHSVSYNIPTSIFPYIWRVTGLFNESVPFVIYLLFSYLYFKLIDNRSGYRVALLLTVLSGAKSAILIIITLYILRFFKNIRVYLLFPILYFLILFFSVVFINDINEYLLSKPQLYSIYLRLSGLIPPLLDFSNNLNVTMFGSGFVSSADLMTKGVLNIPRGTDYFSMFIYANGIIGTILLNIPVLLFFIKISKHLSCEEKNILTLLLFSALMLSGSYTLYVYAYLIFTLFIVLIYRSKKCSL